MYAGVSDADKHRLLHRALAALGGSELEDTRLGTIVLLDFEYKWRWIPCDVMK